MPAHLRAALTPVQLSIPVENGQPTLGKFQAVFLLSTGMGATGASWSCICRVRANQGKWRFALVLRARFGHDDGHQNREAPMRDYACAILVRNGTILRDRRAAHRRAYLLRSDVSGGRLEDGEPLNDALCRELGEDLGIVPTTYEPLGGVVDNGRSSAARSSITCISDGPEPAASLPWWTTSRNHYPAGPHAASDAGQRAHSIDEGLATQVWRACRYKPWSKGKILVRRRKFQQKRHQLPVVDHQRCLGQGEPLSAALRSFGPVCS